jgi:hypothetical protein
MPSETSPVDPDPERVAAPSTVAPHPEEMKGTVTFSLGNWASMTATGRATPAGLICAAALACAVLIPVLMTGRRTVGTGIPGRR